MYLYESLAHYFSYINRYLNIFLTFYWWIFFVPFLEINIGILICGPNAFLSSERVKDYNQCMNEKSIILEILSILGIFLAIMNGLVIIIFFRNHKFNEENRLKRLDSYYFEFLRRFKPLNNLLQLLARSGIMACYYIGTD
jgi:hypothetical protein